MAERGRNARACRVYSPRRTNLVSNVAAGRRRAAPGPLRLVSPEPSRTRVAFDVFNRGEHLVCLVDLVVPSGGRAIEDFGRFERVQRASGGPSADLANRVIRRM